MQRITTATKVANLFGAGKDGFRDGDLVGGVFATDLNAAWFNGVQEEVLAVIEDEGLVPDANVLTQLRQAIDLRARKLKGSFCAAGGTADAITGDFTPDVTAYTDGMRVRVRAAGANTSATPTFKPDALAAKTIVKGNGLPLVGGDIAGAGHPLDLQYDLTLDKWVLLNPATGAATVTSTNDPTFADNGFRPASTNWVRGAMSAIATAAGFASSFGANGYVKFPSWLGGWVIEWGTATTSSGSVAVTFPLAFPSAVYTVIPAVSGAVSTGSWGVIEPGVPTLTGFTAYSSLYGSASNAAANGSQGFTWFAIGK